MKRLLILLFVLFTVPAFSAGILSDEKNLFFSADVLSDAIIELVPEENQEKTANIYEDIMDQETGMVSIEGLFAVCRIAGFNTYRVDGFEKCKEFITQLVTASEQELAEGALGGLCPGLREDGTNPNNLKSITDKTRVGDFCSSTQIAAGEVIFNGIRKGREEYACTCLATACYPGFSFNNGVKIANGTCQTIIADQSGACLREEHAKSSQNDTTQKCKDFCVQRYEGKGCSFSSVVMSHTTGKCICNANQGEIDDVTQAMKKAEEERIAALPYYEVCGKDKGKGVCIEKDFNWIRTNRTRADIIITEYAKVKKIPTLKCSETHRLAGNDDFIKCVTTDGKQYYEFKFDSVTVTNDNNMNVGFETALCNLYGGSFMASVKPKTGKFIWNDTILNGCRTTSTSCASISSAMEQIGRKGIYDNNICIFDTTSVAPTADGKKVCKENSKSPYCIQQFEYLHTTTPMGIAIAYLYADKHNIRGMKCNDVADTNRGWLGRVGGGDDFVQCQAGGNDYEFRFGDLSEGYDDTRFNSDVQAICSTMTGNKVSAFKNWNDNYFGDMVYCPGVSQSECTRMNTSLQSAATPYQSAFQDNVCTISTIISRDKKTAQKQAEAANQILTEEQRAELKKLASLQPNYNNVKDVIESNLARLFPNAQRIQCASTTITAMNKFDQNTFRLAGDDFLLCWVDDDHIIIELDDSSEQGAYERARSESAMNCYSAGGQYQGKSCHGFTQSECLRLNEALLARGLKGANWNTSNRTCNMADAQDKATKDILQNVGLIVGGTVLAVFTGGASLVVVIGAIADLTLEGAQYVNHEMDESQVVRRMADFETEAKKCKNETCAYNAVKNNFARMNAVLWKANSDDKQRYQDMMTELAVLIGDESKFIAATEASDLTFGDKFGQYAEQIITYSQIVVAAGTVGIEFAGRAGKLGTFGQTVNRTIIPSPLGSGSAGAVRAAGAADDAADAATSSARAANRVDDVATTTRISTRTDDVVDVAFEANLRKTFDEVASKNQSFDDFKNMFKNQNELDDFLRNRINPDDLKNAQLNSAAIEKKLDDLVRKHSGGQSLRSLYSNTTDGASSRLLALADENPEIADALYRYNLSQAKGSAYSTFDSEFSSVTKGYDAERAPLYKAYQNERLKINLEGQRNGLSVDDINAQLKQAVKEFDNKMKPIDEKYIAVVKDKFPEAAAELVAQERRAVLMDFIGSTAGKEDGADLYKLVRDFEKLDDADKARLGDELVKKLNEHYCTGDNCSFRLRSQSETALKDADWGGLYDGNINIMKEKKPTFDEFISTLIHEDAHRVDDVLPNQGALGEQYSSFANKIYRSSDVDYTDIYRANLGEQSSFRIGNQRGGPNFEADLINKYGSASDMKAYNEGLKSQIDNYLKGRKVSDSQIRDIYRFMESESFDNIPKFILDEADTNSSMIMKIYHYKEYITGTNVNHIY